MMSVEVADPGDPTVTDGDRSMFFLLRAAFWLSLLILLLPADPAEVRGGQTRRELSTFEAIGAAQSTFEDLRGFCDRNPSACDTGRTALAGFGAKARTGVRWVSDQLDGVERTSTGSTPTTAPVPAAERTIAVPLPPVRPAI